MLKIHNPIITLFGAILMAVAVESIFIELEKTPKCFRKKIPQGHALQGNFVVSGYKESNFELDVRNNSATQRLSGSTRVGYSC